MIFNIDYILSTSAMQQYPKITETKYFSHNFLLLRTMLSENFKIRGK